MNDGLRKETNLSEMRARANNGEIDAYLGDVSVEDFLADLTELCSKVIQGAKKD